MSACPQAVDPVVTPIAIPPPVLGSQQAHVFCYVVCFGGFHLLFHSVLKQNQHGCNLRVLDPRSNYLCRA